MGAGRVLKKPLRRAELLAAINELKLARGNGKRKFIVLVVDDDPKAVELVAKQLKDSGCEVLRASGGREALVSIGQGIPDLIILDLMMPNINGFDVVEALKLRKETAAVPIIILTAKVITPEDRKRLNGYVEKIIEKSGFDRDAFLAEVRRALGKKK